MGNPGLPETPLTAAQFEFVPLEWSKSLTTPTPPAAEGHILVHTLPTVTTMASAVYHGSYDAFEAVSQVYAAVGKWIEANGYRINGASRELYIQPPDWSTKDPIGVMEIQFPVEKADSAEKRRGVHGM